MTLVLKEVEVTGTTPVQILSSSLVARHLHVMGAGAYLGPSNSNAEGFHLFDYRTLPFTLAAGDALWAWADTTGSGVVQLLASTALGL